MLPLFFTWGFIFNGREIHIKNSHLGVSTYDKPSLYSHVSMRKENCQYKKEYGMQRSSPKINFYFFTSPFYPITAMEFIITCNELPLQGDQDVII